LPAVSAVDVIIRAATKGMVGTRRRSGSWRRPQSS